MPELRCDVKTCAHNRNFLCDLDRVNVGGETASCSRETSCDSFTERIDGMTNASRDGKKAKIHSEISCDVRDCIHNQMCRCHADNVSVQGREACSCHETCCSTFRS